MSALARILARGADPEADVVPGKPTKPILPVPLQADELDTQRKAADTVNDSVVRDCNTPVDSKRATIDGSRIGQTIITNLPQALDASVAFIARYMRFDNEVQLYACALWCAYCWVYQAFDFAPYLFIRSPEKRCGKSRLVKCLRCLAPQKPRQIYTANISVSDMAFKIDKHKAILFLEEVDKFFGRGTDEPIVGILNAGWEVGATYDRRDIASSEGTVEYDIYGPKCFSGIGHTLDDTTADRSIHIRLSRQSPDNKAERLREAQAPREAAPIRDFFEIWAKHATRDLQRIAPTIEFPKEMDDGRVCDMTEGLLSVAELAGEPWRTTARNALVALTSEVDDSSEKVQLLKDIRVIFETKNMDRITSHMLLDELIKMDDSPWAGKWERDLQQNRYLGPAQIMSGMLSEFKIKSHNIRTADDGQAKGYSKADFAGVWTIYCPRDVTREQVELKL